VFWFWAAVREEEGSCHIVVLHCATWCTMRDVNPWVHRPMP
jgi:hypothetical protein